MSKTKKQILIFIVIILIGVGYAVNEYIITPEKLLIQQKVKQVEADKLKLVLLKSKSSEVVKLKAEVEELKQAAITIGDVTVKDIDTPQLTYDFYNSCKTYGIKGEDLAFQLVDNDTKVDKATNGSASKPSTEANAPVVSADGTTTVDNTANIDKTKTTSDLLKLTIELKVSGSKTKVEKYIRSLNTLTSRKINVKSIKLKATLANVVNAQGVTDTTIIPNISVISTPVTDQVTASIIFNQYVYGYNKDILRSSSYSFYDGKTGLSDFSDMFK
ncbi:MAG: hypothetical protein H7Y18_19095 [Clostridiaceae bacterium]|nr:hypothetical protein [Clostridiaceae bacterium]